MTTSPVPRFLGFYDLTFGTNVHHSVAVWDDGQCAMWDVGKQAWVADPNAPVYADIFPAPARVEVADAHANCRPVEYGVAGSEGWWACPCTSHRPDTDRCFDCDARNPRLKPEPA